MRRIVTQGLSYDSKDRTAGAGQAGILPVGDGRAVRKPASFLY